jgi:hypothetical protein
MESGHNVGLFYFCDKPDGSWNLFCPKCLLTVATAKDQISAQSSETWT